MDDLLRLNTTMETTMMLTICEMAETGTNRGVSVVSFLESVRRNRSDLSLFVGKSLWYD